MSGTAAAALGLVGWLAFNALQGTPTPAPVTTSPHATVVVESPAAGLPAYAEHDQQLDPITAPREMSGDQAEESHEFPPDGPSLHQGFPYAARINEPRGKVVLQAGPSMFSKNLADIPDGTPVLAHSRDEKWIQIHTTAGVGFVKRKELAFSVDN